MIKRILILLSAVFILFSCSAKIAIKVNDSFISFEQLQFELNSVFNGYPGLSESDKKSIAFKFIETIAVTEAACQKAVESGLAVSDQELDERINELSSTESNNNLLISKIWGWPDNPDTVRLQIKKRMLAEKLYTVNVQGKIRISEDEILEYYENNKFQFIESESVDLMQIYFEDNSELTMQEARKCYNELLAGRDFESLAKEYSDFYDIGKIQRGLMDKAFDDVAFSTQEGHFSEPFVSSFGIHIIYVKKRYKDGAVDFETASAEIEEFLTEMLFYQEKQKYIENIKKEADIMYSKNILEKLDFRN